MRLTNILACLIIFGGALYLYGCDSSVAGPDSLEMDLTANERNGTQSCTIQYEGGPEGLNKYCFGPIGYPVCPGSNFTCRWRIGTYWVDQSDVYLSEEVGEIEGAPNSPCTGRRCHFHCSNWEPDPDVGHTCDESNVSWYGDCIAGVGDTQCH